MTVRMMIRAMLVVAATAMILVGLTACGGGSAQEQSNKPRPLPEKEGVLNSAALRPGEYRSEEFEPSFTFRVGKGWSSESEIEPSFAFRVGQGWSYGGEAPDVLHLGRGEKWGWLAFTNIQHVYKPGSQGQIVEAPKDLVSWYQHHPYPQTSKPEPISVGGVKGVQFDVVVEDVPDYKKDIGTCRSCVDIIKFAPLSQDRSGDSAWVSEKEKQRTIVLEDVKGETVTIIYAFLAPEFDELAPEAQRVIDSVKWTGS